MTTLRLPGGTTLGDAHVRLCARYRIYPEVAPLPEGFLEQRLRDGSQILRLDEYRTKTKHAVSLTPQKLRADQRGEQSVKVKVVTLKYGPGEEAPITNESFCDPSWPAAWFKSLCEIPT
jgi:hypothetical protein